MLRTGLVVALVTALPACGGAADGSAEVGDRRAVVVLAAASLTEPFTELAQRFEATNPGSRVVLSFGPSSGLAQQVTQGAPADVFAAANPATMDVVVRSGRAVDPAVFARNRLQVAVPPGNPARISTLADLGRPGLKVALCQPSVPCGSAAATVLRQAGLRVTAASQETDVRAVLVKVELGEVDAGLVYVSDVRSAGGRVRGIDIPPALNTTTTYPVAALRPLPQGPGSADAPRSAARAFVRLVRSAEGAQALRAAGFLAP